MKKWKRKIGRLFEKKRPPLERVGYLPYDLVCSTVRVDRESYKYMTEHKDDYDAVMGLTEQMAEKLKPYVSYTEYFDIDTDEWVLGVSLKVVK